MDIEQLVKFLIEKGLTIATAESCTGGGIASALTDIAGSSACFGYGIVCYSNEAKEKLLAVPQSILSRYGAVSQETALAMANGLAGISGADINLAVTGIAGPTGGCAKKPVGLVYIAIETIDFNEVQRYDFKGDRAAIRRQTVEAALLMAEAVFVRK